MDLVKWPKPKKKLPKKRKGNKTMSAVYAMNSQSVDDSLDQMFGKKTK